MLCNSASGETGILVDEPPFSSADALVQTSENLEPHLYFPQQQRETEDKLRAFRERSGRPPNILILVADDMGWGDPGVYGGGAAVGAATPSLDRLAREGLRLTSTYAQPTCSPTRATLMTGRLPLRHGVLAPPQIGESTGGVVNEYTLPEMLSDAGYHTAMTGKWHLGEELGQQPQFNGFDEYYGMLGSVKNYTAWRDDRLYPTLVREDRLVQRIAREGSFIKSLIRADRDQAYEEVYELDIDAIAELDLDLMQKSVSFIHRMADSEKPWLLYHAFGKPHFDNYPSKQFTGKSAAKGVYQDAVVEIDHIVGEIVRALEASGQAENTLVFFTSDNGPSEDSWPDSGHTPFRGAKGSTWEGGVRVPGIAWWPGMIAAGRVSDGLFDLADIYVTAAGLANAKLPDDVFFDGVDQSSFLLADEGESNRGAVFYYLHRYFAALRVGPMKTSYYMARQQNPGAIVGFLNDSLVQRAILPHVVNLYTDPRERMPMLVKTAIVKSYIDGYKKRHHQSLENFPPAVVSVGELEH